MDIPYTQQFSVKQTPLGTLLPILRQHAGDRGKLRTAFASAFFKGTKSSEKIAGNTLIALKAHGIIESNGDLTPFGRTLINLTSEEAEIEIARNLLKNLGGFQVVETLREMKKGGHDLSLVSVTAELKSRGLTVSENSSDLSGVRGWLEAAGVLNGWEVLEDQYAKIIGAEAKTIDALKDLTIAQ